VDTGFLCDKAAVLRNIVKWIFPVYIEESFTKINLNYSIMLEEWKYVEK
jgi:hypothetical protein